MQMHHYGHSLQRRMSLAILAHMTYRTRRITPTDMWIKPPHLCVQAVKQALDYGVRGSNLQDRSSPPSTFKETRTAPGGSTAERCNSRNSVFSQESATSPRSFYVTTDERMVRGYRPTDGNCTGQTHKKEARSFEVGPMGTGAMRFL